jgi:hypothetical protein
MSGGEMNTAGAQYSSISGGLQETIGTAGANLHDWRAGDNVSSDK